VQCSLYIHLPFCRSKCRYCDFYSVVGADALIDGYLKGVAREWDLRTRGQSIELSSVFIGGGTPSLLSVAQWECFGGLLLERLPVVPGAEWTIECNPESFSDEKGLLFARMGVNRLTFGIQSLADRELGTAGRPHSAGMALEVLDRVILSRFRSVGVDVMYGLPGQSPETFTSTLHRLLKKPVVGHLSAYELTIASGTPFGRHRALLPFPTEDAVSTMVDVLAGLTKEYGFRQYEVSNFARSGHECRHNKGYWNHAPYLGLGCAAHSYVHPRRRWNVSDVNTYCSLIEKGVLPVEREEELSAEMVAREMLFLGFRRAEGINERLFEAQTGMQFAARVSKELLERFVAEGLLINVPPSWMPTEKGLLFADYMARELF
jgi:oxygen-independent coproporphyrinogen-3 oxidase